MRIHPLFLVLIAAAPLVAQEASPAPAAAMALPPAPIAVPVAIQASMAAPVPSVSVSVTKNKDTVSVDFPDEEIRVVLRNVADLFELNLVIPDTLQGRTSLKLREVTWRQIFQVVLSSVGYTFIEDGNIIKIVSNDALKTEPTTTELIKLNNISSIKIAEALKSFIDEKGGEKIQAMPDTNFVAITATPGRLTSLKETIAKVDSPASGKAIVAESDVRQILIETKFIEVTNGDSKNIGMDWSSLSGYALTAGGMARTYGASATKNTSDGSTNNNGNTTSNTVTITNGSPAVTIANGSTQATTVTGGVTATSGISRIDTAIFSASDFKLVLNALQTSSNSRLISNPTLITFNGRESTLHVGDDIPVSGGGSAAGTSGMVTKNKAEHVKSGIILNFIPQIVTIQPAGLTNGVQPKFYDAVRLDLSKPSSKVKIEDAAGGIILRNKTGDKMVDGNLEPIFSTRSIATEVVLRDGYTMGIGGMIESNQSKQGTRVPLLGSIPLLGRLFRSDNDSLNTRNMIVFITAKIINPVESNEQFTQRLAYEKDEAKKSDFVVRGTINPNSMQAQQIERKDLPGFRESTATPFYVPPPTAKEIKAMEKAKKKAEKEQAAQQATGAKMDADQKEVDLKSASALAK